MSSEDDDLQLSACWDELLMVRRRSQPEPEPEKPLFPNVDPADLVIGTRERILVVIKPTGELIYGEGYTPDDAAKLFWERMAQTRIAYEEKMLIIRHMESILVRLGQQDLECERLRLAAAQEEDPIRKAQATQMADLAINRLNMVATQAIELGRGLARRNMPTPAVPNQVPASIAEDPSNSYVGREGLSNDQEN